MAEVLRKTGEKHPQSHEAAASVLSILQADPEKWQQVQKYFEEHFNFFRHRDRIFPDSFLSWNLLHLTSGFRPYRSSYFVEQNVDLQKQFKEVFNIDVPPDITSLLHELSRLLFLAVVNEKIVSLTDRLQREPAQEESDYGLLMDNPQWQLEKLETLKRLLETPHSSR